MKNNNKMTVLCVIFACFMLNIAFFVNFNNKSFVFAEEFKKTSAKSAIVIEKNSGRILFSENENEKLPMASLTKIITAIYVIENIDDLDKLHEISKEATGIEGSSIYLKVGERLSVKDLLYGLMLRSGNDAAVALALLTSGSIEKFANDVNIWLKEKGFENTHIMNPHGLHHEDHFTTAYDLAKITAYALSNQTFREIVASKEKIISNDLTSNKKRLLKNKNKFLKLYEFADGVKTGYTKKAGRCFVGSSTKDGMQVICVLLNCVPMFEECLRLTQEAYEKYELVKLIDKNNFICNIKVDNKKNIIAQGKIQNDFYYPLTKQEIQDIKVVAHMDKDLTPPFYLNKELGYVEIRLKNQLLFSDKIYNISNINNNSVKDYIERIVENM